MTINNSEISNDPAQTTEQSEEQKTTLTLQDIAAMVQVIQLATERIAWKADELSSVGILYDRMVAFLKVAGIDVNNIAESSKE